MKMCFLDLFQGSPHLNLGERVLTKYNGHFGKTNVLVGNKCLWIWQVQSLIYVLITKSLFHIQMNNFTTDLCLNSTFYFKWDIQILDLLPWLFYFFLFDIFISSLFQLYVKKDRKIFVLDNLIRQSLGWDSKTRGPVSQWVWHDKKPSSKITSAELRPKCCLPSPKVMTSPY